MSDSTPDRRKRAGRTPQLSPGTVIDGRFRIEGVLGKGGMGSVYEAVNIKLRKRVAIKVLKPELATRNTAVARFLREARAASVIEHRNIVDIHDYGEFDGGLVYYVMEHLQGRDLAKLLTEVGRLRWARARGILLQAVRALKAAHDAGIIHRDIKPANIFLVEPREDEPPDSVKVLDFGIAKTDGASPGTQVLTGLGDLMGTAWYMAPEQARGVTADSRTDIYAMGIVMYQVLTGRVPFDDADSFRVLLRHANEEPKPLLDKAPDLPSNVQDVVLRCLAKEPDLRFQTMRALEHALSSIGPRGEAVEPSTRPPREGTPDAPLEPPLIRPPEQRAPPAEPEVPEVTAVLEGGGLPRSRMPQTQHLTGFEAPRGGGQPAGSTPQTQHLGPAAAAAIVTPPTQVLAPLSEATPSQPEPTRVEDPNTAARADAEEAPTKLLLRRPAKSDPDEAPTRLRSRGDSAPLPTVPARKATRQPRSSARRVSPPSKRPDSDVDAVPAPPVFSRKPAGLPPVPSADLGTMGKRSTPAPPTALPGAPQQQLARATLPSGSVPAVSPSALPSGPMPIATHRGPPAPSVPPTSVPPSSGPFAAQPFTPPTDKRRSRHSQRRWVIVATLAGVVAVGLGGWVALLLTERASQSDDDGDSQTERSAEAE